MWPVALSLLVREMASVLAGLAISVAYEPFSYVFTCCLLHLRPLTTQMCGARVTTSLLRLPKGKDVPTGGITQPVKMDAGPRSPALNFSTENHIQRKLGAARKSSTWTAS